MEKAGGRLSSAIWGKKKVGVELYAILRSHTREDKSMFRRLLSL